MSGVSKFFIRKFIVPIISAPPPPSALQMTARGSVTFVRLTLAVGYAASPRWFFACVHFAAGEPVAFVRRALFVSDAFFRGDFVDDKHADHRAQQSQFQINHGAGYSPFKNF